MGERRKYAVLFAAAILAARECAISDPICNAELILGRTTDSRAD
jgi:hypothetical protein